MTKYTVTCCYGGCDHTQCSSEIDDKEDFLVSMVNGGSRDPHRIRYSLVAHNNEGLLLAKEQSIHDIQYAIEIPQEALKEMEYYNDCHQNYTIVEILHDFMEKVEHGSKTK